MAILNGKYQVKAAAGVAAYPTGRALCIYDNTLYAAFSSAVSKVDIYKSTDGTTWTSEVSMDFAPAILVAPSYITMCLGPAGELHVFTAGPGADICQHFTYTIGGSYTQEATANYNSHWAVYYDGTDFHTLTATGTQLKYGIKQPGIAWSFSTIYTGTGALTAYHHDIGVSLAGTLMWGLSRRSPLVNPGATHWDDSTGSWGSAGGMGTDTVPNAGWRDYLFAHNTTSYEVWYSYYRDGIGWDAAVRCLDPAGYPDIDGFFNASPVRSEENKYYIFTNFYPNGVAQAGLGYLLYDASAPSWDVYVELADPIGGVGFGMPNSLDHPGHSRGGACLVQHPTDGLCIYYVGFPMSAVGDSEIQVAGAWKTITDTQIQVGGAWKDISEAKIRVGNAWKSLV